MRGKLNIGIFQFDIEWEDIPDNLSKIESFLETHDNLPELMIFPEMFTTGFCMTPKNLDSTLLKKQIEKLSVLSRHFGVNLMGSIIVNEGNKFYNRHYHFSPYMPESYYDKRHLFRLGKENEEFEQGIQRTLFKIDDVLIFPQVCYDLRFPVWSRNNMGYHIIVNVANWPSSRQKVWDTLLKARAIENQCYVVGVNRVGKDKNDIEYIGGSKVIGPRGEELLSLENTTDYKEIELNIQSLLKFKEEFPVHLDADEFEIKNRD